MTAEEHIARLTELARRVPEWRRFFEIEAQFGDCIDEVPGVEVLANSDEGVVKLLEVIAHPRALHALEAALRELADPPTFKRGDRVQLEDGRRGSVLWVIPARTEVAVQLDNEPGSYHIHPSGVRLVGTEPPA